MIHHGDCLEVMATMPDASVDAIVTDPPYGLEFMGKAWDRLGDAGFHAPKDEGRTFSNESGHKFDNLKSLPRYGKASVMQDWHHAWAVEALRVAKPGAYLLAFGGTRTSHRLACAIEDAGWIIRDTLVWAYASGFPKGRANLKPAWEPIVMDYLIGVEDKVEMVNYLDLALAAERWSAIEEQVEWSLATPHERGAGAAHVWVGDHGVATGGNVPPPPDVRLMKFASTVADFCNDPSLVREAEAILTEGTAHE